MTTQKYIIPFEATHPGIIIKDELEAREDLNSKTQNKTTIQSEYAIKHII